MQMLAQSTSPHWGIVILIGILTGLAIRDGVPMLYRFIRSKAHRDPVLGDWHSIHVTFNATNDLVLKRERWNFHPIRTKGKIKVTVMDDSSEPKFIGYASSIEGPYSFELQSVFGETMYHRVKKVFADQDVTFGIWLGVDYRGCVIASPRVLSRTEISDDDFRELLATCFDASANEAYVALSNG